MDSDLCLAPIGLLNFFLGTTSIIFREFHVSYKHDLVLNLIQSPLRSEWLLDSVRMASKLDNLIVKLLFKIVFAFLFV